MGQESQRTDHLPPEVYANNAKWTATHPAAQPAASPQRLPALMVDFDISFDKFAAHVAYAIRRYVIYRTDGGAFARGLVREKLQPIHAFLLHKGHMTTGQKVRLEAILWRRRDPVSTRRWSLAIEFALSAAKVDADEEVIEVSPQVIAKNEQDLAQSVLDTAVLVAQNIDRQNHNQGDRITKMVEIAARVGYPKFLDLWYYSPSHVRAYLDIHTTNEFRKKMTAQTGGNFPFDGWFMQSGQPWGTHQWREFPFRSMLKLCRSVHNDADLCHAYVNNVFLGADAEIMDDIYVANVLTLNSDPRALGPLAAKFYDHLVETQSSSDHLLSAYIQIKRASGAAGYFFGAQ